MTKKAIFIAMLLVCAANLLYGQSNGHEIKGEVVGRLLDESQTGVMYAAVVLVREDSTFANGAITNTGGDFRIMDVKPGIYKLRIDHIEYRDYITASFSIAIGESKVLPDVLMQTAVNELGEVVVTYKKPLIEIKADKLIFNVSASPSMSGTNGLDLLKKTPGVTIDMDNNISLLGKNGVQIYINGVQSRLSGIDLATFLQSITSDNVEAIEIISNPSSKYDAEGNAGIINIQMKRNGALGFNGNATSSFTQGKYLRYNNSLSLNYGSEKIRANFEIGQSQEKKYDDFLDIKIQNDATLNLASREIKQRHGLNIGIGLEAQLTKNHCLIFNGRAVINQNDHVLKSRTDIYETAPRQLSGILISQSIVDLPSRNYNFNLDHLWALGKTAKISSAASFGTFGNTKNTMQPNTLFEADGFNILLVDDTEFDASTHIDLWSAKSDFEQEWENIILSAGFKYSHIATKNSFDFYNYITEEPVFDPENSNDFNYTENVAALYAILNVKLSKSLKLDAGLRIENTGSRGQLISDASVDNKDVPRNYLDFFPNVGLSFDNQQNHIWSVNIGRRITRPNYQDLNPFETPISQLTVWKGNPFLRPNYIMNYQLSYAYKSKLIITNSFSVTKDFFANLFEITGPNSNQIIPRNMDRQTNYGVSISYPLEVCNFWNFVTLLRGAYKTYEGNLEGTIIDITAKTWGINLQNNIKLPWGITLDLSYFIESDWVWRGSINVRGNHDLSFGLNKNFMDKRLQVRVTGSDILRTTNDYFYEGDYGGIYINGVRSFDTQRFGLGVTFKFGNQQAKIKRKTNSALNDELKRIED